MLVLVNTASAIAFGTALSLFIPLAGCAAKATRTQTKPLQEVVSSKKTTPMFRKPDPLASYQMGKWRQVWKTSAKLLDGQGCGLALVDISGDGQPEIVTTVTGAIASYNGKGKLLAKVKIAGKGGGHVIAGRRNGKPILVQYRGWFDPARAITPEGKPMWSLERKRGINCVAPFALDRANTGFVIGFNGSGGIEIVDSGGKTLGLVHGPGNVWSVAGARFNKQLPEMVLATDEDILVYDKAGRPHPKISMSLGAYAVAALDLDSDGLDEVIAMGNALENQTPLSAFARDGSVVWSTQTEDSERHLEAPIFSINLGGHRAIAFANRAGITFISLQGKHIGHLAMPITGVSALARKGGSDDLIVRGDGYLCRLELPAVPDQR